MYFPKPSLNENDLAIIERGDTATHSIDAGQYVSWHGRTGKAKSAILQGASLDATLFDYEEDGLLNDNNFYDYNNLTEVTLSSGNTTYTAPANGILLVSVGGSGGITPIIEAVNSSNQSYITIMASGGWVNTNIPLVKGQTITIKFTNYVSSYHAYFCPLT